LAIYMLHFFQVLPGVRMLLSSLIAIFLIFGLFLAMISSPPRAD
jgi:hypothetical protein